MQRSKLFILFLFLSTFAFAQIPNPYLFIDWKDQERNKLFAGELIYQDSFEVNIEYNKKSYTSNEESEKIYFRKVEEYINSLSENKCDLLFYIHGFGAHRSHFVKTNNSALQKDVTAKEGSTTGMQITYSWNVGMNYVGGIPKVIDIGEYYGELMAKTIRLVKEKCPQAKINLLTHSMGNRLFLGVYKKLRAEFDYPVIDNHIMAAPDIEPTVFDQEEPLHDIIKLVKNINIYRHNTDRILTVSSQLTETERIGLVGLTDIQLDNIPNTINIVDCSLLNDNERFDMGNHNYYYQSPTVRRDIYNVLLRKKDDLKATRQPLQHPRRFVLQFPLIEN